jgi:hypothetical protein
MNRRRRYSEASDPPQSAWRDEQAAYHDPEAPAGEVAAAEVVLRLEAWAN